MAHRTIQTDNIARGHMAGRDVNVYNDGTPTSLGRLVKKYREEAESDRVLHDYISELKIFTRTVPGEEIEGLEKKLRAGGREDVTYEALELKQLVYEKLKENISSPTFQHLYAYLMSLVRMRFGVYVRPIIVKGADRHEVDKVIFEDVIEPVLHELELCGEIHDFTPQQLAGMIYFLAGNCHIRWH